MKKNLALLAIVSLLVVACAEAPSSPRSGPPAEAPSEPTSTSSPETPDPGPGSNGDQDQITVDAWFHHGDKVFVTQRRVPSTRAVARAAIEALIGRPSDFEANAGLETQLHPDTELLGIDIENAIATIDLSREFDSGGGSLQEQMRLAQVVFTLTQFPTVNAVLFEIEGEPVSTFGRHGIVLDEPQRRKHYGDLYPAILVQQPLMGATVTSPVTVSGDANVFEATVSFRILDANGNEIASSFTTATCGSGCRGDYTGEIDFTVDREQHGVIEVFESSAEDGSDLHKIQIPVTLSPR